MANIGEPRRVIEIIPETEPAPFVEPEPLPVADPEPTPEEVPA